MLVRCAQPCPLVPLPFSFSSSQITSRFHVFHRG
jgi:hypothetical protein